jgi:hypothetical protein
MFYGEIDFILCTTNDKLNEYFSCKGKVHPRTGYEGPEGE